MCSRFIFVAMTKNNFAEENTYLIDTARSIERSQGRISKGDLKAKPIEGAIHKLMLS